MPTYQISDPNGNVLEIDGDSPPTESDLDQIFKAANSNPTTAKTLRDARNLKDYLANQPQLVQGSTALETGEPQTPSENIVKTFARNAVSGTGQALTGASRLLAANNPLGTIQATLINRYGSKPLADIAADIPVDPNRQYDTSTKVAAIAGNALPVIASGELAPLAVISQTAEGQRQQALAQGLSPAEADRRFAQAAIASIPFAALPAGASRPGAAFLERAATRGATGFGLGYGTDVALQSIQGQPVSQERALTMGAMGAAGGLAGALHPSSVGAPEPTAEPPPIPQEALPAAQLKQAIDANVLQEPPVQPAPTPAQRQLEALDAIKRAQVPEPDLPQLSPQAQRMYDQYGQINPAVAARLAGTGIGGVAGSAYGLTQGDTPEDRIKNALLYGGGGALAGLGLAETGVRLGDEIQAERAATPAEPPPAPKPSPEDIKTQKAVAEITQPPTQPLANVATDQAKANRGDPQGLQQSLNSLTSSPTPKPPSPLPQIVQDAASKPVAPGSFIGVQEGIGNIPDLELFNISEPILGRPSNSTISRKTLEDGGYYVPPREQLVKDKPLYQIANENAPTSKVLQGNELGEGVGLSSPPGGVKPSVIAAAQDDEVRRAIVSLVPVDMMDTFIGQKGSAQKILSDKSVLADALSANPNSPIARRIESAIIAITGTEKPVLGQIPEVNIKGGATMPALSDLSSIGLVEPVRAGSTTEPSGGSFVGESAVTAGAGNGVEGHAESETPQGSSVNTNRAAELKPLPDDIEHLYQQTYTVPRGTIMRDYYQIDRTPENPRGRTVDEATLRNEGYDVSNLPRPTVIAPEFQSAFNGSLGAAGAAGSISPRVLSSLGGGAAGAALGYATGDEKTRGFNSAALGLTGLLAGIAAPDVIESLNLGAAKQFIGSIKRQLANETLPVLSKEAPASADLGAEYASARVAGQHVSNDLLYKVLGDKFGDEAFRKKLGAVIVEDGFRGRKAALEQQAHQATSLPDAQALADRANQIGTTIGKKWSVFKNEEEYQKALNDPEVQAAIQRRKEIIEPVLQSQQTTTGGDLAAPGLQTGSFVNNKAILRDEAGNIVDDEKFGSSSAPGNLRNPIKRGSRLNREFKGTANEYELDIGKLDQRAIPANYEEAVKAKWYDQLEKDGVGKILPDGSPNPGGPDDRWVAFPIKSRKLVAAANGKDVPIPGETLWVKPAVADEVRQVLNTDGPLANKPILQKIARVTTSAQLLGLTDAIQHTKTLASAIASSPGGENIITDLARSLPGVNYLTAIGSMVSKARQLAANDPELFAPLAKLAKAGALRPGEQGATATYISTVDKAGRLVLNDLFDSLVKRGLQQDTAAARREFVNQAGQYNPRLMSKFLSVLKDYQISPFVVAGKNFNSISMRKMLPGVVLSKGVQPTSAAASLQLRAQQLGGVLTTLIGVPFAVNYLTTGSVKGRPGTPFGAIDTGKDDKNGNHVYIDPAELAGLRRGMRLTGVNALVNGLENGRNLNHIGGEALHDIYSGAISPYAGPLPQAISTLTTGKNLQGYEEAKSVTPFGQSPNTLRQYGANAKAAAANLIPTVGAVFKAEQTAKAGAKEGLSATDAALAAAKPLTSAIGLKTGKEFVPEQAQLENLQDARQVQIEQEKKTVSNLADKLLSLPRDQRAQFVASPEFKQALLQDPLRAREVFSRLKSELQSRQANLSQTDKAVAKFTAEGGERAQYYLDKLQSVPADQRNTYLQDQVKKKLLTKDVLTQMAVLKSQQLRAQNVGGN